MQGIFQFGEFQVDALARILRREDEAVALNRRAFDVLLYLVQNPGRILTHEELLKNVWPNTFVDENNLAQSVSALRRALGEKPGDNSYIVTLPGRGYQFVSPVRVVASNPPATISASGIALKDVPNQLLLQQHTIRTSVTIEEQEPLRPSGSGRYRVGIAAVALLLVSGTFATIGYVAHLRSARRLTEKDTVVLADFSNKTGDPVFDDTLKTALSVALNQSPFLNVLSEPRVAATLKLMSRPAGTRLTPEVVRDVCQRSGSKAYIAGSIAGLGSQYIVTVEAVNCESGDTLAQYQTTAPTKEKVLDALGSAASKLRSQLGESLATIAKYDVPLYQVTTPSLEALKAYSLAQRALVGRDPAGALRNCQHAIDLDPDFAMANLLMAGTYSTLNEMDRANEYYSKAFQMRERVSEGEKLAIAGSYYGRASGQLDKAVQTFEERAEIYPRATLTYNELGWLNQQLGQYEQSAEAARTLIQLDPDNIFGYASLANADLALQRFDESRKTISQAHARNLDDYLLREVLYGLAFVQSDSNGMAEQQRWFSGQSVYENYGLALASDTEAFSGHVKKARELTREAVDSAIKADNQEGAAAYEANFAVQQAAYGNAAEAEQAAAKASRLAPASRGIEAEAALAFAMVGGTAKAESLAQDLNRRFPLDIQMQSLWLPSLQAQLALNRRDTGPYLNALQAESPVEYGSIQFANDISCLYLPYLRGEAYLSAGQGVAAAAQFHKIIDHSGIVWNCWTGALAHLGLARASALESKTSQDPNADADRVRAIAAYKDFLALWKDADPDTPIFQQAQSEYAKLTAGKR
jgi:eukaryotic-like serine/threonine-protein kinase